MKQSARIGLASVVGVVLSLMGATAAQADDVSTNHEVPSEVSDVVSAQGWDDALDDATAQYGDGDRAYLEALRSVSPSAVTYCTHDTLFKWTLDYQLEVRMPTTSSWSKACLLESGVTSGGVRALQMALNVCYNKGLVRDGDFGPATYNALIQVQSSLGITADGVYGPQTRSNMWFDTTSSNNSACAPASQATNIYAGGPGNW